MEHSADRIRQLLDRFLHDECSDEEKYELLFLMEDPAYRDIAERMMDREFTRMPDPAPGMEADISERIFERLSARVESDGKTEKNGRLPFYRTGLFRMAASFTGLLLLAGLSFLFYPKEKVQIVTTENGRKRTVVLEDGSLVTLNDNSSVSFSADKSRREAVLVGEGYFDVAHDADRPFFVRTSQVEIRVLGTVFNVRSYDNDKNVETTLVRGKVVLRSLKAGGDTVEMKPNEQVSFNKETASFTKISDAGSMQTSWRAGNLYFEDEPASVIFSELEKWFQVKIDLEQDQKNCRFSMNIGNENIEEVLGFFRKTTNAEIISADREYRIRGKLCE